jgi:tetratricopeptide (TPR) repeat protein
VVDFRLLSVDAIGYELINKRFRNPVLGHVRQRLGELLGDSLDAEIQSLYTKEWEGITRSLEIAYAKGQERRPIDNLDCLGVNQFPSLFEKFFCSLVPTASIPAGDAARFTRRKLLGWLEEVKDVRNPIAHPPDEDLSISDALTLADACLRVVKLLQLDEAIRGIEELQAHLLRRKLGIDDDQPGRSSIVIDFEGSGKEQLVNEHIQSYIEYQHLPTTSIANPIVGEVPQRAREYQARPEVTERLSRSGPGVPVVRALTGMPGVGKTQIAADYARSRIDAGWRLVAWINAPDSAQVMNGLAEVAATLGVSGPGANLESIGKAVRRRLEADGKQTLVVFDNAGNLDELAQFVPSIGQCQVIITSNQLETGGLGEPVAVQEFAAEEALSYLARRTGRTDESGARQLARELGFLPVALAQAAAVIKAQHLDYPTYLARLRDAPSKELLRRTAGEPYRHSVGEAITLALDAATESDPTGCVPGIVNVVALLSDAGVNRSLLYAAGDQGLLHRPGSSEDAPGPQSIDEALALLAGSSLLTFSTDDTTVAAHRLTMRIAVELQAQQDTLVRIATGVACLLESVADSLPEPSQNRGAARDAIRQIVALHDNVARHLGDKEGEPNQTLLRLRRWTVWCLTRLRDNVPLAIEYGQPLVADCERLLGPTDPDTLIARSILADACRAAGRWDDAISLLQGTLADYQQVLGDGHPDTLMALSNLARAYRAASQLDEAIRLYKEVLANRERALGPSHPETLTARANLADAYRTAGQFDEAVTLHQRTLADREEILGLAHADTLTSRNDLARAYEAAGWLDEAIALYERTCADREQVLGPTHTKTLRSRSNLARAYQAAGRLDEAVPLYERTCADREQALGDNHPETMDSRTNLGRAYQAAGRLDDAIALYERTLADAELVLGKDHPKTLACRADLASAYRDAGGSRKNKMSQ